MKDLVNGDAVEAEENGETSSSTLTVLLNQDNRTVHQYLFCWVLGQGIAKQGVIGPGGFWCEGFFGIGGIMTKITIVVDGDMDVLDTQQIVLNIITVPF